MFLYLSILYTNALVPVKFLKMAYRINFEAQYLPITLECQDCSLSFVAFPRTDFQAKNPQSWRKYCPTCFQKFQRRNLERKREARMQHYIAAIAPIAKPIADDNIARDTMEAEEAMIAAEAKKREEAEKALIVQMRSKFVTNPDDFFRSFLRLSNQVSKLTEEVDGLSEKADSYKEHVSLFETASNLKAIKDVLERLDNTL